MTVDNCIFDFRPHFLSTDCRKSRNNSTSIFNRLFSYLYSCSVFAGLRPRCFGMEGSFSQLWIAYLLIPYSRLIAHWLSPAWILITTSSRIPVGYFFMPFLPDIITPPDVVIILHQGAFCLLSVFTGSVQSSLAFLFSGYSSSFWEAWRFFASMSTPMHMPTLNPTHI